MREFSRLQAGYESRHYFPFWLSMYFLTVSADMLPADPMWKFLVHSVGSHTAVAIEDLNVKGMQKNYRLAKAVGDASMSQFLSRLECKCTAAGKMVVRVSRWFASSQICSSCGYVKRGQGSSCNWLRGSRKSSVSNDRSSLPLDRRVVT